MRGVEGALFDAFPIETIAGRGNGFTLSAHRAFHLNGEESGVCLHPLNPQSPMGDRLHPATPSDHSSGS